MIAIIFIVIGLIIMFFGVFGMIVLPDFLLRIHSSTKCGVTGAINILIGFMILSGSIDFILRMLLLVVFLFFTAPIIAHSLAIFHLRERQSQFDEECND